MTGVEILATEEVAVKCIFNWTACFIVFGSALAALLLLGLLIDFACADRTNVIIGAFLGLFFGLIFGSLAGFKFERPIEFEIHHKVTIADEVDFNEFVGKYEILDQEGKIYTVKEKENNNA